MWIKQIAFALTLSILFSSVSKTVLFLHYKSNFEYYAKVLCENKQKPTLQCNGKCHLKKEMKRDDQKQNSPVSNTKVENINILYVESLLSNTVLSSKNNQAFALLPAEDIQSGHLFSVFHPPHS